LGDEGEEAAKKAVEAADAAITKAKSEEKAAKAATAEADDAASAASSALDDASADNRSRAVSVAGEPVDVGAASDHLSTAVAARADHHPHESPWQMTTPLIVLAGLSIVGGLLNLPFTKGLHFLENWLEPSLVHEHVVHASAATKWILAFLAIGAGAIGIYAAAQVYLNHKADPAVIERPILADAWRYDRAVSAFMGGPGVKLFDAVAWFDATIIDGIVNGAGRLARESGGAVRKIQTGFVRTYALGISLGSVALLVWFLVRTAA
jgi:NADH-quinone oxidoreductase subunit L